MRVCQRDATGAMRSLLFGVRGSSRDAAGACATRGCTLSASQAFDRRLGGARHASADARDQPSTSSFIDASQQAPLNWDAPPTQNSAQAARSLLIAQVRGSGASWQKHTLLPPRASPLHPPPGPAVRAPGACSRPPGRRRPPCGRGRRRGARVGARSLGSRRRKHL